MKIVDRLEFRKQKNSERGGEEKPRLSTDTTGIRNQDRSRHGLNSPGRRDIFM